jgi:hypothetical protein
MGLSDAFNRIVVPKGDANRLRFSGQAGHYEVYYLTLNQRAERLGVWLRYTLDSPLSGAENGYCELWAHVFDGKAPERSVGLKERMPLAQLARPEGGILALGKAVLRDGEATGEIIRDGRQLAWTLRFSPLAWSAHLAPFPIRALGLASTNVIYANLDTRFSGSLTVDGRTLTVESAPGCQTHLWGKKHAERWAWGHCNEFDGRDDCVIDGVAAWLKKMGRTRGPLTGMFIRYRGEDYCTNAIPNLFRSRAEVAFPAFRFEGGARGHTFRGEFSTTPDRMLQVGYEDPDGEKSYCANTEVGDLKLEVFRGSERIDVLTATGTAHFEFGDRAKRENVRLSV